MLLVQNDAVSFSRLLHVDSFILRCCACCSGAGKEEAGGGGRLNHVNSLSVYIYTEVTLSQNHLQLLSKSGFGVKITVDKDTDRCKN